MAFHPKDNPLKDIKINVDSPFDSQRIIYMMMNGTDKGYTKQNKIETLQQRQKRESKNNLF